MFVGVFKILTLTMNEDVLTRTPPKYDLRLKYGTDENQFGDLRLPKGNGPHPLLMIRRALVKRALTRK